MRAVDNLWEKYAMAVDALESDRAGHAQHNGRFSYGIGVLGMTLPDGWLIKPLAEVAQVIMGQSPDSKYYSEEEVGLPFLQGCAEFQGRHPEHGIYCSHKKKIGRSGSTLLSVRAPVGRLNIANRDYVIGRGLAALNGTRVTQGFLEHFLVFQEPRFRLASQGSTFEAINSRN